MDFLINFEKVSNSHEGSKIIQFILKLFLSFFILLI